MSSPTAFAVLRITDSTSGNERILAVPLFAKPKKGLLFQSQLLADIRKAHVDNARGRGVVRSDNALRDEVQPLGYFTSLQSAIHMDEAKELA